MQSHNERSFAKAIGYYAHAYVDDGVVIIIGEFIGVVCECMQTVCKILEQW